MKLTALLLLVLAPLCGCDIFLDDMGGDGMPCYEPNDCQKGLICDQQHICRKVPDQTPFATECQPETQESCKGEFGECVCFPGMACYCTRPCSGAHECDDVTIGERSARCTLMDPIGPQGVCADWQWTNSYGNVCIPGNIECDNGECVEFPADGLRVCSTSCPPACPEEYACEPTVNPQGPFCGLAYWFGFWHGCNSDPDCEAQFPSFPICKNNQNCSKPCASNGDCPPMSHCDNPPTGDCVPDII